MAIRREDQSLWERRAPLAPHHVRKLIRKGKLQNFCAVKNRVFVTIYANSWPFRSQSHCSTIQSESLSNASLCQRRCHNQRGHFWSFCHFWCQTSSCRLSSKGQDLCILLSYNQSKELENMYSVSNLVLTNFMM